MTTVDVYLEVGGKKTFAGAIDWPGWTRSGRDEHEALAALGAYAPRYAVVTERRGHDFQRSGHEFVVVERLAGSGSTDFGAPNTIPERDRRPIDAHAAERLVGLVSAAWEFFDDVVAASPPRLRKGPRGGGRDRDAIAEHVATAEASYARHIGVRVKPPGDRAAVIAMRDAIAGALHDHESDTKWPIPYAARRIAWHVLDHAWEIEDKRT
jgi:hypothetical protein